MVFFCFKCCYPVSLAVQKEKSREKKIGILIVTTERRLNRLSKAR